MSRHLKKAGSLLNIICRSSHSDCVNLFENLDKKGVELICKLVFYIVSGNLTLDANSHARLKKKIKKHISEVKQLFFHPRNHKDIRKKRKILQKRQIVSILTAIANAATPVIAKLVTNQI